MRNIEVSAKTVDQAIEKGLQMLGVNRDDIEVKVIQNPSKGFLGLIGAKEGIYEVTVMLS